MNPEHTEDRLSKEETLELLINHYGENIKRLTFTYVRNWSTAEDLTQEIFITCYLKMGDFRRECSYKTWLYKIAINKCKDFLKSRWNRFEINLDNVMEKISGRNISLDERVISNEQDNILSQYVLSLSEKYREMIILYYYEELKIWEIEELTGINQDTIKTRLHRAKRQLQKKIGGNSIDGCSFKES